MPGGAQKFTFIPHFVGIKIKKTLQIKRKAKTGRNKYKDYMMYMKQWQLMVQNK